MGRKAPHTLYKYEPLQPDFGGQPWEFIPPKRHDIIECLWMSGLAIVVAFAMTIAIGFWVDQGGGNAGERIPDRVDADLHR